MNGAHAGCGSRFPSGWFLKGEIRLFVKVNFRDNLHTFEKKWFILLFPWSRAKKLGLGFFDGPKVDPTVHDRRNQRNCTHGGTILSHWGAEEEV